MRSTTGKLPFAKIRQRIIQSLLEAKVGRQIQGFEKLREFFPRSKKQKRRRESKSNRSRFRGDKMGMGKEAVFEIDQICRVKNRI